MAINRYRFYLGPLGYLTPLPGIPIQNVPAVQQGVPGAIHTSLGGRTTVDRLGTKTRRSWNLAFEWLTEDQELWIQAALRRSAALPLRVIDPRKRNLAPEDVSTGGSTSSGVTSWIKTGAATLVWTAGSVPTALEAIVAGRLVWTAVTNTQTLYGNSELTPMLAGSTYRVSAYVKTTTTFRFSARPFNLAGVEQATVTDATNNASTAGVWTRLSWLYTPAGGISSAYFGLTATGSGNIETTGWSYQVDESLKNWSFGYGCPEVVPSLSVAGSYWRIKYTNVPLALVEV